MVEQKLQLLLNQINFLMSVEQDSLGECIQEMGNLMVFIDKAMAQESEENAVTNLSLIKNKLLSDYEKMKNSLENEIDFLKKQEEIVAQAIAVKKVDEQKFQEIGALILADVGETESEEEFKERIMSINQEGRNEFLMTISEIKDAVMDASLDDLVEILANNNDEDEIEEDEEDSEESAECCEENNDECCEEEEAFDLTKNEKIVESLKKFSDPYFVEKKDK